jgi:hypothetical protein
MPQARDFTRTHGKAQLISNFYFSRRFAETKIHKRKTSAINAILIAEPIKSAALSKHPSRQSRRIVTLRKNVFRYYLLPRHFQLRKLIEQMKRGKFRGRNNRMSKTRFVISTPRVVLKRS